MSESPYTGWFGGDAGVWCEASHESKPVQPDGDSHVCPECGQEFKIDGEVEVVS